MMATPKMLTKPTAAEIVKMRELVRQGMQEKAFGMSAGLGVVLVAAMVINQQMSGDSIAVANKSMRIEGIHLVEKTKL